MRIHAEFGGVIIIDIREAPGSTRRQHAKQHKHAQEHRPQRLARPDFSNHRVDRVQYQKRDEQRGQPAACLQQLIFAQPGKRTLPGKVRAEHIGKRNHQNRRQDDQRPTALEERRPFDFFQDFAQEEARDQDERHGEVHCQPGHFLAGNGERIQDQDAPVRDKAHKRQAIQPFRAIHTRPIGYRLFPKRPFGYRIVWRGL